MQNSVQVKSFELSARDIAEVDVALLHALSMGVGWPHRAADWDFLRSVGRGIAAVDGIGRVFGSAMWFPHAENFATIGLVLTTPRAQAAGAGRWMMEQIMHRCAGYDLGLTATKAAYPLYLSLGFDREATVYMRQGIVAADVPPATPNPTAAAATDAELEEIGAFDAGAYGVNRTPVLRALANGAVIRVLRRGGALEAYAMRRKFGRGDVVGPIVARSDADAIAVAASLLDDMRGSFVRIDTREARGDFAAFLERSGLAVANTATTMSRGRRILGRAPGAPRIYGLAGHALG